MIKAFDYICRFFLRFRYPITLPEEVAQALGIEMPNFLTFDEFVQRLTCPDCHPKRLCRFMPRYLAEEAFLQAHCREQFKYTTLFSFYFSEGCLEFILHFDDQSLLRRLYIHHKCFKQERGIEIRLTTMEIAPTPTYRKYRAN